MRKLVYVGAATFLVAAALGGYLATHTGHTEPVSGFSEEEQEDPSEVLFPVGDLVYHTPPSGDTGTGIYDTQLVTAPGSGQSLNELTDTARATQEPIVVASPAPELPPVTEVGGAVTPGEGFGNGVVVVQSAPRPDEEAGHGPAMPYVAENNGEAWLAARLWAALYRVLTGPEPGATGAEETQEPPVADSEPAIAPKPETLPPQLLPPTGMDYHYHQQCCPYTGRCPLPYHPAPPPGPGRE